MAVARLRRYRGPERKAFLGAVDNSEFGLGQAAGEDRQCAPAHITSADQHNRVGHAPLRKMNVY